MQYRRALPLPDDLKQKSILLLGPRQTGKSTLATLTFPHALYYNVAHSDTFRELSARPELIRQRLQPAEKLIVIDEAQRLPELFDEVQVLLDRDKNLRVLLTGSSARKLRRGKVNLLPGRVWQRFLHPLVSCELGAARFEERAERGSLPGIIDSPRYQEELKNYVGLYLEEEVRAEGVTRNIGSFSRFLNLAALCNTQQLNFTKIANDAQVSVNTARSYFQILYDTLLAYELGPYRKTKARKAVAAPKFYLFDAGVANALLGRFQVPPGSDIFGKAMEHLIFQELKAYLDYRQTGETLHYWRSLSHLEVDFILGEHTAIEVKASASVYPRDERGLQALTEELKVKRRVIVCNENKARWSDMGTQILPVEDFCQALWAGEFV